MQSNKAWSSVAKTGFRFWLVYVLLTLFPFPLTQLPVIERVTVFYDVLRLWLVQVVTTTIFGVHYNPNIQPNGSGDSVTDYVWLMLVLCISLVVALVWSIADKRTPDYNGLYKVLRIYVRYFLAVVMIEYAVAKIFQYQFPALTVWQLNEPLGNSSPMGLFWKFMGYSKEYSLFAGISELIAGLLLINRRTTLAGALLAFIIMLQVVALNFCYNVPVKLFAVQVTLLCIFIILPDVKRLYSFFIAGQLVEVATHQPYTTHAGKQKAITVSKYLFILIVVVYNVYNTHAIMVAESKKPLLYGLYDVETFVLNNDTLPPLTTSHVRWKQLSIQYAGYADATTMAGEKKLLEFNPDSIGNIIVAGTGTDTIWHYNLIDSTHLHIIGKNKQDTVNVLLRRKLGTDFPLQQQKFNWVINEPVNN